MKDKSVEGCLKRLSRALGDEKLASDLDFLKKHIETLEEKNIFSASDDLVNDLIESKNWDEGFPGSEAQHFGEETIALLSFPGDAEFIREIDENCITVAHRQLDPTKDPLLFFKETKRQYQNRDATEPTESSTYYVVAYRAVGVGWVGGEYQILNESLPHVYLDATKATRCWVFRSTGTNNVLRTGLLRQISRLKQSLSNLQESAREKNLELDALHHVWCTGLCGGGQHRYTPNDLTPEMLRSAIYQVTAMVSRGPAGELRKQWYKTLEGWKIELPSENT